MKLWIARDKHIPDGTFPYPEGFNGNLFLYGSEPYIKKMWQEKAYGLVNEKNL